MDTEKVCQHCAKPLGAKAVHGLCPECFLKVGLGSEAGAGTSGSFATLEPQELAPHFPQFEILELLGRGGMGAVYKARQKALNRLVALKVLTVGSGRDPAFAERFAREAQAMARLNHSNIVTVHEFGEAGGFYFFVMEFVDGINLRQMIRAHRLSPREAMAIVPQICEALQYAHDQGIVHRDIKPENVLIDKVGRVKIADFGLAKLLGRDSQREPLTRSADVMGTPQYMAPEQFEKPLEVDHRADIFSLGVVFYEMLTGELPLGRFAAPSRKVQVDVRLDEIVLRALEKEPGLRYQQAGQLKTQVETVAASTPVGNQKRKTADAGMASSDADKPSFGTLWKSFAATVAALILLVLIFAVTVVLVRIKKMDERAATSAPPQSEPVNRLANSNGSGLSSVSVSGTPSPEPGLGESGATGNASNAPIQEAHMSAGVVEKENEASPAASGASASASSNGSNEKLEQLLAELAELRASVTESQPLVLEKLAEMEASERRNRENERPVWFRKIERNIRDEPWETSHPFEIWEAIPGNAKGDRVRGNVRRIPLLIGDGLPRGEVFYIPDRNRYYIQWDPAGAGGLRYYGPFEGEPIKALQLPLPSPEEQTRELAARFRAASAITSFSEKDAAMASIARDAGSVGNPEIARKALGQITAFNKRDDATLATIKELAKNGCHTEAIEIARTITAFNQRDAALRELAGRQPHEN